MEDVKITGVDKTGARTGREGLPQLTFILNKAPDEKWKARFQGAAGSKELIDVIKNPTINGTKLVVPHASGKTPQQILDEMKRIVTLVNEGEDKYEDMLDALNFD